MESLTFGFAHSAPTPGLLARPWPNSAAPPSLPSSCHQQPHTISPGPAPPSQSALFRLLSLGIQHKHVSGAQPLTPPHSGSARACPARERWHSHPGRQPQVLSPFCKLIPERYLGLPAALSTHTLDETPRRARLTAAFHTIYAHPCPHKNPHTYANTVTSTPHMYICVDTCTPTHAHRNTHTNASTCTPQLATYKHVLARRQCRCQCREESRPGCSGNKSVTT